MSLAPAPALWTCKEIADRREMSESFDEMEMAGALESRIDEQKNVEAYNGHDGNWETCCCRTDWVR